jgi:hypothetical protein
MHSYFEVTTTLMVLKGPQDCFINDDVTALPPTSLQHGHGDKKWMKFFFRNCISHFDITWKENSQEEALSTLNEMLITPVATT